MDALTPWLIAALPFAATFGGWAVKTYIGQVASERGPKGDRGDRGQDYRDSAEHLELVKGMQACQDAIKKLSDRPFIDMSVRDCEQLSDYLMKQFNGRYMLAPEAREKFAAIHHRIDALSTAVTTKIDGLRSELVNRLQ